MVVPGSYTASLLEKYPEIPANILKQYKPADEYIVVNTDTRKQRLKPVRIYLPPEPEDLAKVVNFGLPAKEQKVPKYDMPPALKRLVSQHVENRNDKKNPLIARFDKVWEALEENREYYKDEIEWMRRMWFYSLYGFWVYINGKVTYLDGWHFFYLNFWHFETGELPEYRSASRKFFLYCRYAYNTRQTFAKSEKSGASKRLSGVARGDGWFDFVDMVERVCAGVVYPKPRRMGATNMALCIEYFETIIRIGVTSGIISMTGKAASDHFKEILVPAFRQMPFFFRPRYDKRTDPATEIDFTVSAAVNAEAHLASKINCAAETAQSTAYDRYKLLFLLCDEEGKTTEVNVVERWQQLMQCMVLGDKLIGFSLHPSTVGHMTQAGGRMFFDLCENSMFHERNENGRTITGLFLLFLSAADGFEGYVDEFGDSIIEDPPVPVMNSEGKLKNIGAKTFIERERKTLLALNTKESLEKYNEWMRLYPLYYEECFRTEGGNIGFDIEALDARMDELRFDHYSITAIGNFEWEGNIPDSRVKFEHNVESGKFHVTKWFAGQDNQRFKRDGMYYPVKPKVFTSSADSFKFNKTESKRMSDGGYAVLENRNFIIDPIDKDIRDWESYGFVCTYLARPDDKKTFAEDCLKADVFFGAMQYPEMNVPTINDHYLERGYGGYLKFDLDAKGIPKPNPGFTAAGVNNKVQQLQFNWARDYIKHRIHRERHLNLVEQFRNIGGIEEITDYDLFAAATGAGLGSESNYDKVMDEMNNDVDLGNYLESFHYD